jgi:hypothetical protein
MLDSLPNLKLKVRQNMAGGQQPLRDNRQAIRYLLSLEPRMTGEQIARLLPFGENGEELSPFKPRADRARVFPGSYPKIMDMLQRMYEAGEVDRFREHGAEAYIYMLKTPNMKFPGNWYNRRHELSCADVFTSLYPTGHLEHWDYKWSPQEHEHYAIDKHRVYYDRKFVAFNNVFLLEVDRGTEDSNQIDEKIEKYLTFAKAFQNEYFFVIITVQGSRYYNLKKRFTWMLEVLKDRHVGYQFLVADHDVFLKNPLGQVLGCANAPDLLALSELETQHA